MQQLPDQDSYKYAAHMQQIYDLTAANEGAFYAERHRTLPITATVTPIANYPQKLRIYKTMASCYWQVRCFFKGKTYTQSLRTTNKKTAISAAKTFFHIKTAELYEQDIKQREQLKSTFAEVVPAMLATQQARVARKELTAEGLRILQNRLHKSILPMLGNLEVAKIGYTQLNSYVAKLSEEGLTATTIQQHLVAIRKVLGHAHSTSLIASLPKFPNVKVNSKSRGGFTVAEYKRLAGTARQHVGDRIAIRTTAKSKRAAAMVDRYAVVSDDLHWLIRFMVNSFVRPTDIKHLRHKHVTVVRGKHTYLRLNLPESKLHDKPIVTMQAAVGVYERLHKHYAALGMAEQEDYLFMPNVTDRGKALEFLGWQLKYVQGLAQVGTNAANGKTRTLYSLRHTAIRLRLQYGRNIDLLTLARNARTSVEMVEKFYASELTAEMNIDLLQGKRR